MAASSSGSRSFPGQFSPRSSHSRSASWSYTRGDGQINLSSHLEPITSMIRDLGLGFGPPTYNRLNSDPDISNRREDMSESVYVDIGEEEDNPRVLSRHHSSNEMGNGSQSDFDTTSNDNAGPTGTQNSGGNNGRANADRMEFQGTIKWIENSVPFLLLLLSRIMWDHRLGMPGNWRQGRMRHPHQKVKPKVVDLWKAYWGYLHVVPTWNCSDHTCVVPKLMPNTTWKSAIFCSLFEPQLSFHVYIVQWFMVLTEGIMSDLHITKF